MADENKTRDAAEAVKGLLQAVPVYQDGLPPAVKEIGVGLQTVAKTVHIVLAPIAALVWGYDQIKDFVSTKVAEKLKNVPVDRIRTPEPNVVGPALEALRYTGHQETLRELYAKLLATALDADTAQQVHPAFVDMIKNMSPDEARIMQLFAGGEPFPAIEVRAHSKDQKGYRIIIRSYSQIGQRSGSAFPNLTPNYLDNLARLGLIESPGAHGLGSPHLTGENVYDPLEKAPEIIAIKEAAVAEGHRLEFGRTFVRLTDLGRQFCIACVLEKSTNGESAA